MQLQKSLSLFYLGGYFLNLSGQNEKWLGGSGGQLLFILPSGQLRRWKPFWGPHNIVVELHRRKVTPVPSESAPKKAVAENAAGKPPAKKTAGRRAGATELRSTN